MVRGAGTYGDVEVHPLETVYSRYSTFFDDPSQIFSSYLPFAVNVRKQDIWVLDVSAGEARFAKISHETVPDDWPDERWVQFSGNDDLELQVLGL